MCLLENQLELLSEKMYGSPAKSAARERDRCRVELFYFRRFGEVGEVGEVGSDGGGHSLV